jgi:hypothetical protein
VAEINLNRAQSMNIAGLNLITNEQDPNIIEIQNLDNSIDDAKMVSLIIKLLQQGKYVIYNPKNKQGYNSLYYDSLKAKLNLYKSLEFVFAPEITSYEFTDFFKPKIQSNMPMFFSPKNEILLKFLSMFLSLEDLSNFINYGSYEFMSRIRVGYLFPSKNRKTSDNMVLVGGNGDIDNFIDEYENGLEEMYGNSMSPPQQQQQQMLGGIKSLHKKTYKKRKNSTNKKRTMRKYKR